MVRTDIAFVLLLPFASIDEGNWSLVNSPCLDVSVMLSTDQTARSNVQPVRTKNVSPLRLKLKWAAALCLLLDVLSCFLYSGGRRLPLATRSWHLFVGVLPGRKQEGNFDDRFAWRTRLKYMKRMVRSVYLQIRIGWVTVQRPDRLSRQLMKGLNVS